jgi:uncharacterized membrane-anchored protein YitT (DUF2179 family)
MPKTPRKRLKNRINQLIMILVGIFMAGLGIKGFLLSSNFIDGGVVGISMLIAHQFNWSLPLLMLIINIPFILMGLKEFGLRFSIKSTLAILGLALCLLFVPYPNVTSDKLLTALFGGFFIGVGMGFTIRAGAVLDGTEIAALIISKASHILRVGDIILGFNILIFSVALTLLGVEPALYSILTYLAAAKTANFLIHGIEEYTAITIISNDSMAIKENLLNELNKSVTVYKGAGGVTEVEQDILYCVVSKWEQGDIRNAAQDIDPDAFIVMQPLADVEGRFIKKPAFH